MAKSTGHSSARQPGAAIADLTDTERDRRLTELDHTLAAASLAGYWRERARPATLKPILWRWVDVHAGLSEAGDLIRLGPDTVRRVVLLRDLSLPAGSTRTLTMSAQLVKPGERAPAHRHTAQAVRFMVQGSGAYTIVEGEPMVLEPNDLVLTPGWTWHDHSNPTDEPAIWLDGLDIPLALHLDAQFQENYPDPLQPVTKTAGHSRRLVESVRGDGSDTDVSRPLPYRYPWVEVEKALIELEAAAPAQASGAAFSYANPLTGGYTLPTIHCRAHLLRPNSRTRLRRHTSTTIFHVIQGSGTVTVDGQELHWTERDCFSVPSWQWYQVSNASATEPAILFSISDRPAIEVLGLYREEMATTA